MHSLQLCREKKFGVATRVPRSSRAPCVAGFAGAVVTPLLPTQEMSELLVLMSLEYGIVCHVPE